MLLQYRKDIDGLRAIAVLLVVLFHAKLLFSGGFVGVDVFFVISGFLITSLIQKQILRNKFTFKGFYLHRMRRIMPTLLGVICICFIFNWFVASPYHFIFFCRTLFYSIASLSNYFMFKETSDYFAHSSDNVQLVHTWSLSVEEQFYIIIPIFLILLFKYFYKTKWFNLILTIIFVISLVLSEYIAHTNKNFAYYMLPSRFFEMFTGVFLALNYQKFPVLENKYFNNIIAIIGFLLILIPASTFSSQSNFPGLNAFYVCLGTSLIIYLGKAPKKTLINKLLENKILVFIGLISYSLYLWHWPIFATLNTYNIKLTTVESIGLILSLIFISFLSWKFIEQPFRYKFKWGFKKTFIILFAIPLCFGATIKPLSKKNQSFINYRFSNKMETIARTSVSNSFDNKSLCHGFIVENKNLQKNNCFLGNKKLKTSKVLHVGDSHAAAIDGFVDSLLKRVNKKGTILTNNSIPFLYGIENYKKNKEFKVVDQSIQNEIKNGEYQYIILAGYYNKYIKSFGNSFYKMFEESIKFIIKNGATPIIIDDTIALNNAPSCPFVKTKFNLNKNCNIDYSIYKNQNNHLNKFFEKMQQKYPQITRLNLNNVLCSKKNGCKITLNGVGLYYDDDHLSYKGGKEIFKEFSRQNQSVIKKLM